jgi:hypothetical protein
MSALVEYTEGSVEFGGYMGENIKPTAIARFDSVTGLPFVAVRVENMYGRDGLRLELDDVTATQLATAIRRALTEYHKRTAKVLP